MSERPSRTRRPVKVDALESSGEDGAAPSSAPPSSDNICHLCGRPPTNGNKTRIPKMSSYGALYQPMRRFFSSYGCPSGSKDHRVCRQQLRRMFPSKDDIKLLEREKRAHCYNVELLDKVLLSSPPLSCHKTCLGGLRALLRLWNNVAINQAKDAAAAAASGRAPGPGPAVHFIQPTPGERMDTPPSRQSTPATPALSGSGKMDLSSGTPTSRPSTSFSVDTLDTSDAGPTMPVETGRVGIGGFGGRPMPAPLKHLTIPPTTRPYTGPVSSAMPFSSPAFVPAATAAHPHPHPHPHASSGHHTPLHHHPHHLSPSGDADPLSAALDPAIASFSSSLAFLDPLFGGDSAGGVGSFGVVTGSPHGAAPPDLPLPLSVPTPDASHGRKRSHPRTHKRRATGLSDSFPTPVGVTPTGSSAVVMDKREQQRQLQRFIATEIWPAATFHKSRVNEFRRALHNAHVRRPSHLTESPPQPNRLFANIDACLRKKGLHNMTHGEQEAYLAFYRRTAGADDSDHDSFISDVADNVGSSDSGGRLLAVGSRSNHQSKSGGGVVGGIGGSLGGGGGAAASGSFGLGLSNLSSDLHLPSLTAPDHSAGSDFTRLLENVHVSVSALDAMSL